MSGTPVDLSFLNTDDFLGPLTDSINAQPLPTYQYSQFLPPVNIALEDDYPYAQQHQNSAFVAIAGLDDEVAESDEDADEDAHLDINAYNADSDTVIRLDENEDEDLIFNTVVLQHANHPQKSELSIETNLYINPNFILNRVQSPAVQSVTTHSPATTPNTVSTLPIDSVVQVNNDDVNHDLVVTLPNFVNDEFDFNSNQYVASQHTEIFEATPPGPAPREEVNNNAKSVGKIKRGRPTSAQNINNNEEKLVVSETQVAAQNQQVVATVLRAWQPARPTRNNGLLLAEQNSQQSASQEDLLKVSGKRKEMEGNLDETYVNDMKDARQLLLNLHEELAKNPHLFRQFDSMIKAIKRIDEQEQINSNAGTLFPTNRSATAQNLKLMELLALHKYLQVNKVASGVAIKQLPLLEAIAWATTIPTDKLTTLVDRAWNASTQGTVIESSIRKEAAKPIADLGAWQKKVQDLQKDQGLALPPSIPQEMFGLRNNLKDDLRVFKRVIK